MGGGGVVIWLGQFAKKSVWVGGGGRYVRRVFMDDLQLHFFLTLLVFFLFVLIFCYNICFSFLNIGFIYKLDDLLTPSPGQHQGCKKSSWITFLIPKGPGVKLSPKFSSNK